MRCSIDCRYIRERPSGIGEYTQALVDRIPKLDPGSTFQLWVDPRAARPLSRLSNVREAVVQAPANSLRTLWVPNYLAKLTDVDVFHAPFNLLGRGLRCATVVTLHDLMWLLVPEMCEGNRVFTSFQAKFYRDGIMRALSEASRIIAISRATADAVALVAPKAIPFVEVIHHGIADRFRPPADRAALETELSNRFNLRDPYFLVVGQNSPSKNHGQILEAFSRANLPRNVKLVFLQRLYPKGRFGGQGRLDVRAQALGISDRVSFLHRVSSAEVVELVQGALALIQFSLFEGFGMPALEAMACGTPVVASDIPPLREVLGGAGLTVPISSEALASALLRVAKEKTYREELRHRGTERAREFSWDRCAGQHLDAYRAAFDMGPRMTKN